MFKSAFGDTSRGESKYGAYETDGGKLIRVRMSDHRGNALSIIKKGGRVEEGYSVVIKTNDKPKFKPNKKAYVTEYVYNNPTKDRLVNIAKSVFGLIDREEYVDLAEADEISYSPRNREGSLLVSFSKEAISQKNRTENFKKWFGDWEEASKTPHVYTKASSGRRMGDLYLLNSQLIRRKKKEVHQRVMEIENPYSLRP